MIIWNEEALARSGLTRADAEQTVMLSSVTEQESQAEVVAAFLANLAAPAASTAGLKIFYVDQYIKQYSEMARALGY